MRYPYMWRQQQEEAIKGMWVHPSYRDAMVEYLVKSPRDRLRYLETCDIGGVLLALSSFGGYGAPRYAPLLIQEKDWRAVSDRITSIAGQLNISQLDMLVYRLVFLQNPMKETDRAELLLLCVDRCYGDIVQRLNQIGEPLESGLIRNIAKLSISESGLRCLPCLRLTLSSCFAQAEDLFLFEEDNACTICDAIALEELAESMAAIYDVEPRTYSCVSNWSPDFLVRLKALAAQVKEGNEEYLCLDETDAEKAIEYWGSLSGALKNLASLPARIDSFRILEAQCETNADRAEHDMTEAEPPDTFDYSDYTRERHHKTSIVEYFRDL